MGVRPSSELGLLLQNISSKDAAKIAAFLKLGTDRLRHRWKIVSDTEPRVLVSGSDYVDTLPAAFDGPIATLRLVDDPPDMQAAAWVLPRPLQFDDFINALVRAEVGDVKAQPERAPTTRAGVSSTLPARTSSSAVPADGVFVLDRWARFRLRRWPEAALLGRHRYHVRLASFLSTRHLSIAELVSYSNVSEADCAGFLQALGDAGLLDAQAPQAASPAPAIADTPPASPAGGLLGRLRRRLGLE